MRRALEIQRVQLVPLVGPGHHVGLALAIDGVFQDDGAGGVAALRGLVASSRADEMLAAVGLSERAAQRLSRLSTGERARVAIARALAARPALLLVDEPTSRLDQANAVAVAALLARLAREHDTAVVCATHDPVVIDQTDEQLALSAPLPTLEQVALDV